MPEWMSDGRHVVFISNRSGHHEMWSVNVVSGALTQMTRGDRGTDQQYAQWSPDGRRLAALDWRREPGRPTRLEIYETIVPGP